jgi:anti-sigma factor RsiW
MIFLRHPDRWLAPFAEGELDAHRRARVAVHLSRCARCTERLAAVERGLLLARELRPEPPPVVLDRAMADLLAGAGREDARPPRRPPRSGLRWAPALAAAAVLALLVWLGGRRGVELESGTAPPGQLEQLAAASHRELVGGQLSLAIAGDSTAEVRDWLLQRGLVAALAEAHPPPDGGRYLLRGAADVSRPGLTAAAVLYEVDGAPLSLVVARQDEVRDAPRWGPLGKRVRYRRTDGVHLLTWTNSGKAYSLAAGGATSARVQRGCLLCHASGPRAELARRLELPPPRG